MPYSEYCGDVKLGSYVATAARRLVREIASLDAAALSAGPLADRLAENVPRAAFKQPLMIAQGDQDEVIAPSIQDAYVASQCASGQPVEYRVYPGKSHFGVVDLGSPLYADLEQWTKDRSAGLPPKNTCLPWSEAKLLRKGSRRCSWPSSAATGYMAIVGTVGQLLAPFCHSARNAGVSVHGGKTDVLTPLV